MRPATAADTTLVSKLGLVSTRPGALETKRAQFDDAHTAG